VGVLNGREEFDRMARRVSNWGRWGSTDELGTLNLISPDKIRAAAACVRTGELISLGMDLGPDGPQGGSKARVSPFRVNPLHFMLLDGGDTALPGNTEPEVNSVAEGLAKSHGDGLFRFNEDYVVMPLQAATQWDALSHVYYDGRMYNDIPASTTTSLGASVHSIRRVGEAGGVTSRGVLLDVCRFRQVEYIDGGDPIGPAELDEVAVAEGVEIAQGDVVLVKTGWITKFRHDKDGDYLGCGIRWDCAEWLHDKGVAAVACDNKTVEAAHVRSVPATRLPLHLLALRDMGMPLGELFDLDELSDRCAADGIYDFFLTAPALRFVGGVATPLNPVAVR
jgi:kynurenine formamidase